MLEVVCRLVTVCGGRRDKSEIKDRKRERERERGRERERDIGQFLHFLTVILSVGLGTLAAEADADEDHSDKNGDD